MSSDGKTSYERVKGKPAQVIRVEFGEKVLWKFPVHGLDRKMQKINARWSYGLFLGVRSTSGELIVADQETKSIQVHPYSAACSPQGTVVVRQFAVGVNRSVEQRDW